MVMPFIVFVMVAYFSICFPVIVMIWSIIGISHRFVIPSVWAAEYQTKAYGRSYEIAVERAVHIMSVVDIDESPMMAVKSTVVIVYIKTTNSGYPTTIIVDIYIPNLGYPTVVVIVDGNILNLYNCTVIVILYIWVVIVT